MNIRKHKERILVNRGYFLTINSDYSGSTVQRPAGESPQTYNSSSVTPPHRRAVLLGEGWPEPPPLSSELLAVPAATINPIPAETEGQAKIFLLALTSHKIHVVHKWEALNLYASSCTNSASWAPVQGKKEETHTTPILSEGNQQNSQHLNVDCSIFGPHTFSIKLSNFSGAFISWACTQS